MNLLLFLSAILSALTGVVGGVRPVEVSVQQSSARADVQQVVIAALPMMVGHMHLLGAFGAGISFSTADRLPAGVVAPVRLYLDRPRA